jgi:2'-5' RNA ligase
MSRVRTFIAIDPGNTIRERLIGLQQALGRAGTEVKWVEPDNLHVTLLFLGEVDMVAVPSVCEAVAEGCRQQSAFAMTIEKAGCFPNPRRPRILWAGVGQGVQEVCSLHDRLEEPLLALGCYRREERQYSPHITLGRVRSAGPTEKLAAALAKQAAWKGGETMVREVLVMGSELTPQGPIYTVLSRTRLSQ